MTGKRKIDVERVREDTPGCEEVIHFNNAGASLMPRAVLNAVIKHLELEASIGGYEAAKESQEEIENVYDKLASLIGCNRDEIAVVENATRAWDMAFYSIPFKPSDRILTCKAEYVSNFLAFLQVQKRTGVEIEVIPNDRYGQLSVEALKDLLDERVKLIAITHVPTNGGLVNPASEVGKIARDAGVFYLLDACQSIGQIPIDVGRVGCDMLSATGRKYLRGPRGTGFLYVNRDSIEKLEPPFIDLHAAEWISSDRYKVRPDARRFENWETNYAGKVGLGKAVEYACELGLDVIWDRVSNLGSVLRSGLNHVPGITVHDLGKIKCGIVSFNAAKRSSQEIMDQLYELGINVSVTDRESTLLDMESRSLNSLVRASVHYYNTEEEIELFCAKLGSLVN